VLPVAVAKRLADLFWKRTKELCNTDQVKQRHLYLYPTLHISCTKDIFIFIAPLTGVGAPCGLSLKKIVYFKQSESMQTQGRSALWDKRVGMKDLFGKTVFESLPSYKTQIMVVRL